MQQSDYTDRANRTRRRILAATASVGAGGLIVPTVGANENSQNQTEGEDFPDWFSENPEDEAETVEVSRRVPSTKEGPSIQDHGGIPDSVYGRTIKAGKRTIGLNIKVYDWDNAACNWGMEVGVGLVSASGKRIHCEGDNSISVSPGPVTLTLAAEPLHGSVADEGMKLTGEVCTGYSIFKKCWSLRFDIQFP